MVDKAFNKLPMVVVYSDSLDPRSQRQLKSQLQAETMALSQVDAELKNMEAAKQVKDQLDSVKDNTEFDDEKVKDKADPEAIENKPEDNNAQNADQQQQPDAGASGEDNDVFGGNDESSNQPPQNPPENNENSQGENNGDQAQNTNGGDSNPPPSNPEQQPQNTNADGGAADAFDANAGANDQGSGNEAQQPQQPQGQNQPQQQNNQPQQNNTDGEDPNDPFADNSPKFEAFAGIFGINYKTEDASKQTEAEMPPFKMFILVKGSDSGVDSRTSAVVANIEDPQNAVVVIDLADVVETEAKMQFSALKKQLQGRGITVFESVDEAVEYLNEVYEQVAGGGGE